jgi:hypothetical protein
LNTVGLPAIDIFKGYTDRHPAFASFLSASALFLEERISTHFKTPNRLRKPPILLNRVFLYLPLDRFDFGIGDYCLLGELSLYTINIKGFDSHCQTKKGKVLLALPFYRKS